MRRECSVFFKFCVLTLIVCLTLCGCNSPRTMSPEYVFPHEKEDIERIDLLVNNNVDAFSTDKDAFVLVRSLGEEEIDLFMEAVYEMETSYVISPPLRGHGAYVAKITYSNGDVEMLGSEHIEFIPSGYERKGIGAYYFIGDEFENLFSEYVDNGMYPS